MKFLIEKFCLKIVSNHKSVYHFDSVITITILRNLIQIQECMSYCIVIYLILENEFIYSSDFSTYDILRCKAALAHDARGKNFSQRRPGSMYSLYVLFVLTQKESRTTGQAKKACPGESQDQGAVPAGRQEFNSVAFQLP